jgi:hypothetical protein
MGGGWEFKKKIEISNLQRSKNTDDFRFSKSFDK